MEFKLVFWSLALVNMGAVGILALRGVRSIRAGRVAAHRRAMRLAAWLVAGFLLAYFAKRLLLGAEDLSQWSRAALLNLWIHEALVGAMLLFGSAALLFARRLRETRRVTGSALHPAAAPALLRRHRLAGRIACAAAILGFFTACGILAGMIARTH